MTDNERIAFYINIYNAFTLKAIIDNYPVGSIKDIPGVWDDLKFKVAGQELSLNEIEHQILRKEFNEPRIHFALVCAAKGCPELRNEPYTGSKLDEQLDAQAEKFINNPEKVRLDKENNILYLSSIFKWFKEDFGDTGFGFFRRGLSNVVKFVIKYLPPTEANFVREQNPKVKYLDYDWSLNEMQ